jgi:hypothetical protein
MEGLTKREAEDPLNSKYILRLSHRIAQLMATRLGSTIGIEQRAHLTQQLLRIPMLTITIR